MAAHLVWFGRLFGPIAISSMPRRSRVHGWACRWLAAAPWAAALNLAGLHFDGSGLRRTRTVTETTDDCHCATKRQDADENENGLVHPENLDVRFVVGIGGTSSASRPRNNDKTMRRATTTIMLENTVRKVCAHPAGTPMQGTTRLARSESRSKLT